jgi:hypothetical chaperone protein
MQEPFKPAIYAVDFGTSNSLLAAAGEGATCPPIPLDPDAPDPTILRSVLFFDGQSRFSCGQAALADFVANGMMGRLLRSIKKYLPDRSFSGTQIGSRLMTIEDLIGRFLRTMRERADQHFGARVDRVILGRPALFSTDPRDDSSPRSGSRRRRRARGFERSFSALSPWPRPMIFTAWIGIHGIGG